MYDRNVYLYLIYLIFGFIIFFFQLIMNIYNESLILLMYLSIVYVSVYLLSLTSIIHLHTYLHTCELTLHVLYIINIKLFLRMFITF